jgi:hypothetical protein
MRATQSWWRSGRRPRCARQAPRRRCRLPARRTGRQAWRARARRYGRRGRCGFSHLHGGGLLKRRGQHVRHRLDARRGRGRRRGRGPGRGDGGCRGGVVGRGRGRGGTGGCGGKGSAWLLRLWRVRGHGACGDVEKTLSIRCAGVHLRAGSRASVGQRRARTAVVHRLEQRLSQAERDFARYELVVRVGVSELAARIAVVLVVDVLVVEH